ncbi:hypothetical protein [Candidatus Merdisoma sp. JLR.KK006]|uniref:hypothetical protein n=1 Tax=Candidatus Merdisoma sp. JLR.KK006 TaxID=3112626 RepID=UPI002FF19840
MKFKNQGEWKNGYKHDGLLFFAQKIEEMLGYYTNHLYKVPVYNSYFLMREYLHVAKLADEKVINDGHLKYVLDEFIESFERDIVVKNNISEDEINYIIQRLMSTSVLDQKRIVHYLYHYFVNYYEMCVAYLKKIVKEEKEKKKIEKALRCYLPFLIGGGYSQEYIYYYCNEVFGNGQSGSMDMLDLFLSRFDFKHRKYTVYVALIKKVEQFKSVFENRMDAFVGEDDYSQKLRYDRKKFFVARFETEQLDENKAAQQIYENVNLFIRFYKFLGDRREEWFLKKCLVKDEEGNCVPLDLKPQGYSVSEDYDDKTIGTVSEVVLTSLIGNAHDTFRVVDKVLQNHNMAIENPDMKTAFLSLWSILEIIGISKRDDTKMAEIEKSLIPVLQSDYANDIFNELHDYVKANISKKDYSEIIKDVEEEGNDYLKIACIVILEKYNGTREKLCQMLENYPLIRSRISQLNEVFKQKKIFLNDLDRYTRRLKWHLRRMYRTRNAIIHSGENPENLKALGEHLHSYVDELLLEIIMQLTRKKSLGTIDNVLISSEFNMDNIRAKFNSKDELKIEDIRCLLE